jgi:SAM-dependent methyltransferase
MGVVIFDVIIKYMNRETPQQPKKIERDWTEKTTDSMAKPGGRDLSDYVQFLSFNPKELEGKVVLDLGSGALEKFSRNLRERGIEAEVYSLNPDYFFQKYRSVIKNQEDWSGNSVAGLAQALPFKNEKFDRIYGLMSVTYYEDPIEKMKSAQAWVSEVARILKPGGEARFAEILGYKNEKTKEAYKQLIDYIKNIGSEAYIEQFRIDEKNPRDKFRLIIKKPINNTE